MVLFHLFPKEMETVALLASADREKMIKRSPLEKECPRKA